MGATAPAEENSLYSPLIENATVRGSNFIEAENDHSVKRGKSDKTKVAVR
jgi:hypothetical protein